MLRALAGFMMVDGFEYQTGHQVLAELQAQCDARDEQTSESDIQLPDAYETSNDLLRLAPWPI